jgi:hypothetical protein
MKLVGRAFEAVGEHGRLRGTMTFSSVSRDDACNCLFSELVLGDAFIIGRKICC